MKRALYVLLAVVFLLAPFVIAQASSDESIYTYVCVNLNATSQVTNINTTTGIRPGKDRILAFYVSPTVSGGGVNAGSLYDQTNLTIYNMDTTTYLLGERAGANTVTVGKTYVRPLALSRGLSVYQGPGTVVEIEYEKTIP